MSVYMWVCVCVCVCVSEVPMRIDSQLRQLSEGGEKSTDTINFLNQNYLFLYFFIMSCGFYIAL